MRLLFLFLILFSSTASAYWGSAAALSNNSYTESSADTWCSNYYQTALSQGQSLHGYRLLPSSSGWTCQVAHSASDVPPPDPYACSANTRRITFDSNDSFCGSANTCQEIIDYALDNNYQNGSCTDSRNISETATCGDQSILCWTSDDQSSTPVVTSLDAPPSNPNPEGVPTTTLVSSNTDDPDVTHDTVSKSVQNPDGSTTTENTTTSTNNVTGETSTSSNSVTTTPDGEMSVSVGPSSTSNEDQTESSASGGDSCTVAPSCSGDPVGCLNAKQSWLIRCDKNPEVSGDPNNCGSTFACTGDPVYCAALNFDRANHCEGKAIADALGDNFLDDSLAEGQTQLETELGEEPLDEDGSLTSLTTTDIDLDSLVNVGSIFNQSQVAASCPAPYALPLQIGGMQHFDYQPFCDVLERLNPLVITIFSFLASMMIFRGLTETG
jgi:hypothetical protein